VTHVTHANAEITNEQLSLPPLTSRNVMKNKQFAAEARIKALTTLIYSRPQNGPPTSGNAQSADTQGYHHIATLLTRGIEDGGPGRSVIAVTGAHTATELVTAVSSDPGTPSSPPLDKNLTQVHMVVTQNQDCEKASTTFRTDKINPNPKDLAEIRRTLSAVRFEQSHPGN